MNGRWYVWANPGSATRSPFRPATLLRRPPRSISALSASAYGQTPDISGTYWATEYRAKIQIVGGGELPLTAAGKEAHEKNIAGLKDGSVIDAARRYWVPEGVRGVLATPYPFAMFQVPPGEVRIIDEL